MNNPDMHEVNETKAKLSKEEIQNVAGGNDDSEIDEVLGPAGKSHVRCDVNMYKNGWQFSKEKTLEMISNKYSWNDQVQKCAVRYASSIYDTV